VVSLGLLAARRVSLHSAISFGPFLLGGALLAILARAADRPDGGGGPA
jgi:leader peptidase (prepilin peptidase) / N-methyltransferase